MEKKIQAAIYTLGGPPHAVRVTTRDKKDYIRVLILPFMPLLQGGGVLLNYTIGLECLS